MIRPVMLMTFTVAVACAGETTRGQAPYMFRYEQLRNVQRAMVTSLEQGAVAVAVDSHPPALLVLNADGTVQAARRLPDGVIPLNLTSAGGEIFANLSVPSPERGVTTVKMHSDLSVVWARTLRGPDGPFEGRSQATGTRDGGVLLARSGVAGGTTFVRMTMQGDVAWATRVDPSGEESINSVRQLSDGGYVAVGRSPRFAWVVRLTSDGSVAWQRAWGASTGAFISVNEAKDRSLMLLGVIESKPVLAKITAGGELLWVRNADLTGKGLSLSNADDGVLATIHSSANYEPILHVLSLSDDGSIRWQRRYSVRRSGGMYEGQESAMLAPSGHRTVFVSATGAPLNVFGLDEGIPPTGCAWFSDDHVAFTAITLREEKVLAEVSKEAITSRAATSPAMDPYAVAASPEPCPVAQTMPSASIWNPAHAKTQSFRAKEDETAQQQLYGRLLLSKDFARLESLGSELRGSRGRDPMDPNHALYTLYRAFTDNKLAPTETRKALLEEWTRTQPRSITASVALANFLYRAAWDERGSGYADTITATGADGYHRYLSDAQRVLDQIGTQAESDPRYWGLRVSLAHELGTADAGQIGLRGLARHADGSLAERVAQYLTPKWGGSPAIYLRFAQAAADATRQVYGDALYMWLVLKIPNQETSADWKQYKVDWARVKKGADDLIRYRPEWIPTYHQYAFLAHRHGDEETLRKLFGMEQLAWYEDADSVWLTGSQYENARRSATNKPRPAAPNLPPPAPTIEGGGQYPSSESLALQKSPPVMLQTELRYGAKRSTPLAFLVHSSAGVIAVSALPAPLSEISKDFAWLVRGSAKPFRAKVSDVMTTDEPDKRLGVPLGAALSVKGADRFTVKPLQTRSGSLPGAVFVIACRNATPACDQTAFPVQVHSVSSSNGPRRHHYSYSVTLPDSSVNLIGAAIVDTEWRAYAVVTRIETDLRNGKPYAHAEGIANFLDP
jgi:hypothetical protein